MLSERIDAFLKHQRLALVGVSRDPRHFSRTILREFLARGYDVVPIGASGAEVDGRPMVGRLADVVPPVEAVLVMVPAPAAPGVVREAAEAGATRVWLHRGGGQGSASSDAVAVARDLGLEVIPGVCPLMVLPGTSFFHRLHGYFRLRGLERRQRTA